MSNHHDATATPATAALPVALVKRRRHSARRFPLTDLPAGLLLTLVALGIPRTVLADLDIVPAESGLLYYALALTPYAAWWDLADELAGDMGASTKPRLLVDVIR